MYRVLEAKFFSCLRKLKNREKESSAGEPAQNHVQGQNHEIETKSLSTVSLKRFGGSMPLCFFIFHIF